MEKVMYTAIAVFQVFAFVVLCYYLILGLFGTYRKKEKKDYAPKRKFAMIVAAHNEEVVIGKLVKSILGQNYPRELFEVFVIADNCDDNTSKVAKEAGAKVFERFNKDQRGKGYALEWMFDKIYKMDEKFDAICIFDADNLVHPDFLREINSKMKEGYKVVQGYIDSKNPEDSWIATSYSIAFWSQNRMFQLARNNVGFSNQIGGTGFAIDFNTLKEFGWGATCLTEDLEFTCKVVLNGGKIGWAHDAKIYDEKPLGLKASWVQRRRWMQGFTDVASRYFFKLVKKSIKERKWYIFDCALYVLQPFATLLMAISAILTLIQANAPEGANIFIMSDLLGSAGYQAITLVQFVITPLVLILDRKISKGLFTMIALFSTNIFIMPILLKGVTDGAIIAAANFGFYAIFLVATFIFCGKKGLVFFFRFLLYALYTITWVPITIQGILRKNNKEWNPTKHVRNVEICDV